MYQEMLSELEKSIPWRKTNGPATEEQIAAAEQEIGFPFPEELKTLLREMNGDDWVLLSTEQMIERVRLNREIFRPLFESDFSLAEYEERVDRFLFFAANGCGDYFCYRVSPSGKVESEEIYLWEHEELGEPCCWKKTAENLTEFLMLYSQGRI